MHDAVSAGADGLAAAGGDGTQAIVATAAAEHGLPFACIPAGTRNHFALDLGVDRDDVVGPSTPSSTAASTSSTSARSTAGSLSTTSRWGCTPRRCRARATATPRSAPCSTPCLPSSAPPAPSSTCNGPSPDGTVHASAATILVSNNPYRLGHAVGSGTRPRIDAGQARRGRRPGQGRRRRAAPRDEPPSPAVVDHRRSRSTRHGRCRWASTARRSCSTRPCDSGYVRARCAYGSPPGTRVRRRRRCSPITSLTVSAR